MKKSLVYGRAAGITMREMDGDLFLAHEETGSIYRLNATGAAFWRVIDTPQDLNAIIEIFQEAFPKMQPAQVKRDLLALVEELTDQGLISPMKR